MANAFSIADEGLLFDRNDTYAGMSAADDELDWHARLSSFIARLRELACLEYDWDSYGGLPASQTALAACERLIARLGQPFAIPDAYPMPDGGVGLEWESPDAEVSIEVDPHGVAAIVVEVNGKVEAKRLGTTINQILLEFSDLLAKHIPRSLA